MISILVWANLIAGLFGAVSMTIGFAHERNKDQTKPSFLVAALVPFSLQVVLALYLILWGHV